MINPIPFELAGKRVWVAGHTGMVGSAVVRRLASEQISDLICPSSSEVDLRDQAATHDFVARSQPDVAVIAAARVGGIHANRSAQADFLYENTMIAMNSLHACLTEGVDKVAVLGSSCIYPALAPQPMREDYLLTGPLEATNEGYAIAKIAALEYGKMLRRQYGLDVISLMPTNLYGPGDNYDLALSHVLPALLRKTHEAKEMEATSLSVWGTGKPRREFLHVDDLADAVLFSLINYSGEDHLNVGTGEDISIIELARLIGRTVGWKGRYEFEPDMPDGVMRKLLDVSRLAALGWKAAIPLERGIQMTYASYLAQPDAAVETF
ncbi:MAG TPA: GDP-L-fucose synthase [Nitrospira sp.]|nr:GDP-L-fucose synthase [Nitrospira sp.]